MLLTLAYAIITGLDRGNTTPILQYNGAFQRIVGPPASPAKRPCAASCSASPRATSASSTPSATNSGRPSSRGPARAPAWRSTRTPWSSCATARPKGARVGYNPKKRGQRSYHPLLCFEAHRHRKHRRRHGGGPVPPGVSRQAPARGRAIINPRAGRCQLLRETRCRVPRQRKGGLRACSQRVPMHQGAGPRLPFHQAAHRLGAWEDPVPAEPLVPPSPLRGSSLAYLHRPG